MERHLGSNLTIFTEDDFESDWLKVASGGFGQVFQVKHKQWKTTYAVKCSSGHLLDPGCDRTSMNGLIEEAAKMEKIKFQHIVSIYGVCDSPLGIVMEFMDKSLEKILPSHQLAWQLKFRIIHETSLAMNFLHSMKPPLLHLDLKPGNILMDATLHVKISDFGLSKWMEQSSRMQYIERSALRGTLSYIPPEMLLQSTSPPGTKFDVYSFGIVIWEILTQKKPYAGTNMMGIIVSVAAGKRPSLDPIREDWSSDCLQMVALMKRCWDQKPQKRPSFADVSMETDMLLSVTQRPEMDHSENERFFRKMSVKPVLVKTKQSNSESDCLSWEISTNGVKINKDLQSGLHQNEAENEDPSGTPEEVSVSLENESDLLCFMIEHKNLEEVKLLLAKGANVNRTTAGGCTLLTFAVHNRSMELLSLLLEHGADTNMPDEDGWTPLHFVAQNGDDRIARLLLDHEADVDARELEGWTPLHLASQNNFENVVRVLLRHQADPNAQENEGRTPLHVAAHYGHVGLVKMLASRGADLEKKQKNHRTPLHLAVEKGWFRVVQFLLKRGAAVNCPDLNQYTALHMAATKGKYLISEKLIKYGADVDRRTAKGWTPLHLASIKGHVEIIHLLADNGADVNAEGSMRWTPLLLATRYSGEAAVSELLGSGADPNIAQDSGWTPLHLAVQRGSLFSVIKLLEHKADVNSKNRTGWTPTHLAALMGNKPIIKTLLNAGGQLGTENNMGSTPLPLTVRNQKHNMVDL